MLPYRERATHVMAAPMFHSWGWLNHRICSLLDSTEVMIARPTAEAVLDAAAEYRADIIVTTPVVVRRLAEAGPGDRDLSSLTRRAGQRRADPPGRHRVVPGAVR